MLICTLPDLSQVEPVSQGRFSPADAPAYGVTLIHDAEGIAYQASTPVPGLRMSRLTLPPCSSATVVLLICRTGLPRILSRREAGGAFVSSRCDGFGVFMSMSENG